MKTYTLKEARNEMKQEKESIAQAIKVLCTYLDTCPSVKAVVHNKAFALSCSKDIYTAMKVGEEYTVNVKRKNEKDEEYTEQVKRTRKPSADLCLRWFIMNQEANKEILKKTDKKTDK